jgi:four helix bundle protein
MKRFDHEKLNVYQKSIDFVVWSNQFLDQIPKSLALHKQLDRAATSIPLNIAEGNGKFTEADRCRFFDIARGSALECAACLDVSVAKQLADLKLVEEGKGILSAIVATLIGLVRSISSTRVIEPEEVYRVSE